VTATSLYLRCKEDLAAHDGQQVQIVGTYEAIDTRPHPNIRRNPDGTITKSFVIGRLTLDDDTTVQLGIRPDAELTALDGKQVIVTGRLEASPPLVPGMAQPLPTPVLRSIESVTPWAG